MERQPFRRRSTGEVPAERWLDVLRALDHFRRIIGEAPDERIGDAVQLARDKQGDDRTCCPRTPTPERPSSSQKLAAESKRTGDPLDVRDFEAQLLADEEETTLVVGSWTHQGTGWTRGGDEALTLAAAARAREHEQWRAEQRKARTCELGRKVKGDG